MTRTRVFLGITLLLLGVSVVFLLRDEDEEGRTSAHAARVSGRAAMHSGPARPSLDVAVRPDAARPAANALVDDAARLAELPAAERTMLRAGLRTEEIFALKAGFPDWESRFAKASPDMLKAHAKRVEHLVPTIIPDEAAPALGMGDDAAHAMRSGGGVLDDAARSGGSVLDDVARAGGRFGDDFLRLIGLGAAGAGAAGAAALKSRKK